jgi:sulfoxide reductase heme-binding subunit YedZ
MARTKVRYGPLLALFHILALVPLVLLVWGYFAHTLTADPIRAITLRTGKTALTFLILTLAVTPVSTILDWPVIRRLRRPLGLYAFLYALLHFLTFIGLDYGFNWKYIKDALLDKRYALAGLAAFLILLPLAITSTKGWRRLHQLDYLAALLAVLHYVWSVKADIRVPLTYGAVVALLLVLRLPFVRGLIDDLRSRISHRERSGTTEIDSVE